LSVPLAVESFVVEPFFALPVVDTVLPESSVPDAPALRFAAELAPEFFDEVLAVAVLSLLFVPLLSW
jgi:hypothetical protein